MNAQAYPRRADYEPTVRVFLPGCDGEELQMRASLLLLRDQSMAAKAYCCEEAWAVLDHVERLAGRYVFASMPLADLARLRAALVMLVAQASSLEAVFAPELPMGESDGRG